MQDDDTDSPIERFEKLAKRLMSTAKDDLTKVEEAAEEAAEDIVGPRPLPAPATDED